MTIRVSEAEAARDFAKLMESVRRGAEVVIEHGREPVALLRAPEVRGRPVSACLERLRDWEAKMGHAAVPDPGFAADVAAAVAAHREPLEPPAWE